MARNCPKGVLCIDNTTIIYFLILLIVGTYFMTKEFYQKKYNLLKKAEKQQHRLEKRMMNHNIQQMRHEPSVPMPDVYIPEDTENRDMKAITDPLYPPLKRNYNMPAPPIKKMPINIETRGSGSDYQQVGILHKTEHTQGNIELPGTSDDNIILGLYGKPLYKGSNNWLYYVISDKINAMKIPISRNGRSCSDEHTGCPELHDNDTIVIPQYNGTFQVQMYKFDAPRYIPYI